MKKASIKSLLSREPDSWEDLDIEQIAEVLDVSPIAVTRAIRTLEREGVTVKYHKKKSGRKQE